MDRDAFVVTMRATEYDTLTDRLTRAEAVTSAVDRWYTLKTSERATFAEMQRASLAIRAAWEAWKADATSAGGEGGEG